MSSVLPGSTRVRFVRYLLFPSAVFCLGIFWFAAMGSIPDGEHAVNAAPRHIIDIRSDTAGFNLKKDIVNGLRAKDGEEKTLPTLLLYDDLGLKLFERITYLDQYYLTDQEIYILEKNADSLAERIPNGAMVVELGSGYVLAHLLSRLGRDAWSRIDD